MFYEWPDYILVHILSSITIFLFRVKLTDQPLSPDLLYVVTSFPFFHVTFGFLERPYISSQRNF